MDENKQNSSDLADLPELELDDLEFQEDGLESLESLETQDNLDDAFGDLDFNADQTAPKAGSDDPFADIGEDAVATADYDLPEADSAAFGQQEPTDAAMDWEEDSSFQEETFEASDSDTDELTDFSASEDDEIPLPPMMEEDEGPVALSEDELDRILSTDDESPQEPAEQNDSSEDGDFAFSDDSAFSEDTAFSAETDTAVADEDFTAMHDSSGDDDFSSDFPGFEDGADDLDSESGGMDLESAFADDSDFDSSLEMESNDLDTDFADDTGVSSADEIMGMPEFADSGEESADSDLADLESQDLSLEPDEDEGPVALSEDELGNILEDVEEGDPQFAEGLKPEPDNGAGDFSAMEDDGFEEDLSAEISVSDAEPDLGEEAFMKSGDEFSQAQDETDFPVFEDDLDMVVPEDGDDTPVELQDDSLDISDDELSEAVLEGEDFSEEELSSPPLSVLDGDEDESITLTPEELGNIVSTEEEAEDSVLEEDSLAQDAEALAFDEPDHAADLETDTGIPSILDEDEDETIALSASELDNILEDVSEEAVEEEGLVQSDHYESDLHEQEREKNAIVIDESEELEGPSEAIESLETSEGAAAQERQEALADSISQSEGLNKDDLKKMIGYLDRLFDQLPEDTVREFSRSEYFDLYKKVMHDLGIQ